MAVSSKINHVGRKHKRIGHVVSGRS